MTRVRLAAPTGAATPTGAVRPPAVAGTFYPAGPASLAGLVAGCLESAAARWPVAPAVSGAAGTLAGLLVPHAGLIYSGAVAAAAWRLLRGAEATVVILGTNHRAGWFAGLGIAAPAPWATPIGEVEVDGALASRIADLGDPFERAPGVHDGEHSIEVQLPILATVAPAARIVPIAVSTGLGPEATDAGRHLGRLLREERVAGRPVAIAISSDMAHYPSRREAEAITERMVPRIAALDAEGLAAAEIELRRAPVRGVACGMCGIEPAVVGLAALRELGDVRGVPLASATSADAGGAADSTVGYLSVAFVIDGGPRPG